MATSSAFNQFRATQDAVLYPIPGSSRSHSRKARPDSACGTLEIALKTSAKYRDFCVANRYRTSRPPTITGWVSQSKSCSLDGGSPLKAPKARSFSYVANPTTAGMPCPPNSRLQLPLQSAAELVLRWAARYAAVYYLIYPVRWRWKCVNSSPLDTRCHLCFRRRQLNTQGADLRINSSCLGHSIRSSNG